RLSGARIVLTAIPNSGFRFFGWGGACAGSGACTVRLASLSVTVAAKFVAGRGPRQQPVQPKTPSVQRSQAVTARACAALAGVLDDLQLGDAGLGGFDYLNDAKIVDQFADAHHVSAAVADSVRKVRSFVDAFASVARSVGLAPNDRPLPDQASKLR